MSFVCRAHCVICVLFRSGGFGFAPTDMASDHPLLPDGEHIVPSPVDDKPCGKASEQEGEEDG